MSRSLLVIALFVLPLLGVSACGGGGGDSGGDVVTPPPTANTTLTWDQDNWDEKDWE